MRRPLSKRKGDPCLKNPCKNEAACLDLKNGSFYCLCPDKTLANEDGDCDNHRGENLKTNSSAVFSSDHIYSIYNDKNSTDSTTDKHPGSEVTSSESPLEPEITLTVALVLLCVGVILVALYALRHRLRLGCPGPKGSRYQSPLKHVPLSPRYAANPNYYSSAHENGLLATLKKLELCRERLVFSKEIGEGCFGKVFKGDLRHEDGVLPVAVKVLKENASVEAEADFQREVEIMSTFAHENILQLLGVVMKDAGSMPWMVFEYMEFGDLAELLRKSSPHLSAGDSLAVCKLDKDNLLWIAVQVAAGMLYLSQHHFVHRDLATRNCLVGQDLVVKISDFGMSRDIYTCDYYKIGGSRLLPVRWMAPESIMYGKFTLESDIWSFGVLIWEVYSFGKQPYYGHSNEEVVKLILQGILLSPPADCPSYILTIMNGCWRTEPLNRSTFYDIHHQLKEQSLNLTNLMPETTAIDLDNYLIPKHNVSLNNHALVF